MCVCVCVCVCLCVCLRVCMCVCICLRGEGSQKHLYPPCPQVGVTQSLSYQRSMGNVVPGGRNSVLN